MYSCGDFIIDLLKYENHELTRTFVDILFSLGLFPLITKSTRITDISETLINNIFTNQLDIEHQSGLLISDVSDHLPIFSISSKSDASTNPEIQCSKQRKITNDTISILKAKLTAQDWTTVYESDNVNNAYDTFISIFTKHFNDSCPETTTRNVSRKQYKPWFTNGLKNACKKKNTLYKKFLKTKSKVDQSKYKTS